MGAPLPNSPKRQVLITSPNIPIEHVAPLLHVWEVSARKLSRWPDHSATDTPKTGMCRVRSGHILYKLQAADQF